MTYLYNNPIIFIRLINLFLRAEIIRLGDSEVYSAILVS